jgi:hypothetical protein
VKTAKRTGSTSDALVVKVTGHTSAMCERGAAHFLLNPPNVTFKESGSMRYRTCPLWVPRARLKRTTPARGRGMEHGAYLQSPLVVSVHIRGKGRQAIKKHSRQRKRRRHMRVES